MAGSVNGMDVLVNGSRRPIADGSCVADLVDDLGYGRRQVVVELNGEPLDREALASTALRDGDKVEVVRAVAGG